MSNWERTLQSNPTQLLLTNAETNHLPFLARESFATNIKGERILFALFGQETLYSRGVGHSWRFEDDGSIVESQHFQAGYVNFELVTNLDYRTRTARFNNRDIKYNKEDTCWVYRNNRQVNFETSEPSTSEEEDDTAWIEESLS